MGLSQRLKDCLEFSNQLAKNEISGHAYCGPNLRNPESISRIFDFLVRMSAVRTFQRISLYPAAQEIGWVKPTLEEFQSYWNVHSPIAEHSIYIHRTRKPKAHFGLCFDRRKYLSMQTCSAELDYFGTDPSEASMRVLHELAIPYIQAVRPEYAFFSHGHDVAAKHYEIARAQERGSRLKPHGFTLESGLPGIYWINFFGPELLNLIGRQRFDNMPGGLVINLGEVGIVYSHYDEFSEFRAHWPAERAVVQTLGREHFRLRASGTGRSRLPDHWLK